MTLNYNSDFHFNGKLLFSVFYFLKKLPFRTDLKIAVLKSNAKLLKNTGKVDDRLEENCEKLSRMKF